MRVYELARELGIESKQVLEQALELGVEVKTASSSLDAETAELIRMALSEVSADAGTGEVDGSPAPTPEPPVSVVEAPAPPEITIATLTPGASVTDFAAAIGQPVGAVVKELLQRGTPAGAGHPMPAHLVDEIAEVFGTIVEIQEPAPVETVRVARAVFADADADLAPRPPVVTVMGHVDHGKTSLLDAIRKTDVVAGEAGGITQHIGAYQVEVGGNRLTFIDTPGHEAFTALRARGADVTDIVVLVVAADDGPMPQTVEAISHAKAAGVDMIVAINKMDLPGADPFRVRTALTNHGVITEDLGGDVPSVEVSATTHAGIDNLLEVIDLVAQLRELKANPRTDASGVVIESQLDPGRGPVATVIVQRGTLRRGDAIVAGSAAGRVRAMLDHAGKEVQQATPSTPVLVMGWSDVPEAGEAFEVVKNDRAARAIAAERAEEHRARVQTIPTAKERLQTLLDQLRTDEAELRLILKADATGSLEAVRESVAKITREGGHIEILHGAVGGINENDVTLAEVTEAVIVGFNVRPDPKARRSAEQKGIEIRTYGVIYELLEDIELMLVGQLAPEEHEVVLGAVEVRAIFKVPRVGTVAGCYVTDGIVQRGAKARLLRDGIVIHDGRIGSLRRFKDDVREVAQGFECGVGLEGYHDLKEGDVIEVYVVREVAAT
ncbi:MAG: translation initiation factor IF-2 [Acidimicrobiia bacterium]|jgi:translation initiation factor IF-2